MELNRQFAADAMNEGKAAFEVGDPWDACPYDKRGDAEQQVGYKLWNRGYSMARSAAETAAQQPAGVSAGQ